MNISLAIKSQRYSGSWPWWSFQQKFHSVYVIYVDDLRVMMRYEVSYSAIKPCKRYSRLKVVITLKPFLIMLYNAVIEQTGEVLWLT